MLYNPYCEQETYEVEVEVERRHNIPLFIVTAFCPHGRDGRHIKIQIFQIYELFMISGDTTSDILILSLLVGTLSCIGNTEKEGQWGIEG